MAERRTHEEEEEEEEEEGTPVNHHLPPANKNMNNGKRRPLPVQSKPMPMPSPPPQYHRESPLSSISKVIAVILLLIGLTALILWLIYRPYKPQFTVVAAAVYDLNVTSPPFISTSMQFTIITRNRNRRVVIIYDELSAYVSYRNQQITPPMVLPPLYQATKSTVSLSPVLGGVPVPVSVDVVNGLVVDEAYGVVNFRVALLGRLRYKTGAIRTGRYGVYVKCDVWVGLKRGLVGQVPLLGSPSPCKVDI